MVFPDHTHLLLHRYIGRRGKIVFIFASLTLFSKSHQHFKMSNFDQKSVSTHVANITKYVLKTVSLGSKECTKERKLECANFMGQTSYFQPFRPHQYSKFHNKTNDLKGQEKNLQNSCMLYHYDTLFSRSYPIKTINSAFLSIV